MTCSNDTIVMCSSFVVIRFVVNEQLINYYSLDTLQMFAEIPEVGGLQRSVKNNMESDKLALTNYGTGTCNLPIISHT